MTESIDIRFYATLKDYQPEDSNRYGINPGTTVRAVLEQMSVPPEKAKLVFIDGVLGSLESILNGGERIGIFPPLGGG